MVSSAKADNSIKKYLIGKEKSWIPCQARNDEKKRLISPASLCLSGSQRRG
jgi:hypothetical protein